MQAHLVSFLQISSKSSAPPVAFCEKYCAGIQARCDVSVWSIDQLSSKPLVLTGHGSPVLALAFGGVDFSLLCSASVHYVFVWNIDQCYTLAQSGVQLKAKIISSGQGSVQYLSFSKDSDRIAACVGKTIVILKAQCQEVEIVLEGHTSFVTAAEFTMQSTQWVVSVSEDRTFKVGLSCLNAMPAILVWLVLTYYFRQLPNSISY